MLDFAKSIVETVRHPLLVLDDSLKLLAANGPFYQVFGLQEDEVLGRSLYEIDEQTWNNPQIREHLNGVVHRGQSFEDLEVEYETPRLGRRIMVLNARRLAQTEKHKPAVLLAIEDDTERRNARDQLRRLNAELEDRVTERTRELKTANEQLLAANRELEAFCYSVSHDLRAPLRAVDGFSQEILESHADQLDEQGRHYLNRVRAGVQRMGQLIDDLLKLSRITRVEMHRKSIDLSAMAERIVAELREQSPERHVSFTAESGLRGVGDPSMIRIVLENLLANAWKFTSGKTEAWVHFGLEEGEEPNGDAVFFVRDNGTGFDPKYGHKLFGAFQRLHSDSDFPGTGIGLATVQRIIHRHGGRVGAEGRLDEGATFYFTLPEN